MTQSVSNVYDPGGGEAAVTLSCAQIREQLSQYANDALASDVTACIDAHLESCDDCSIELGMLRAEDDLLTDALSDIRPDPSFRAKVGQVCTEALKHAERVANSLPEKGWAIFRWSLATLAVTHFLLLSLLLEPPGSIPDPVGYEFIQGTSDLSAAEGVGEWLSIFFWNVVEARAATYWINLCLFLLALFLLIGGRLLATLERWLARKIGGAQNPGPSRLAVLALEALGICGVIATSLSYYVHLTQ